MPLNLTRRNFIQKSALAPLGTITGTALGIGGGSAFAQTPFGRSGGPKLKISLNAYSFNSLLRSGEMDLFDLLEFCAEHDFEALDPTAYYFPAYPEVPEDSYLHEFKRKAFTLGLEISGTGIKNDFATPDRAGRREGIELTKNWIRASEKMGVPVIRVFAGSEPVEGHTWEETAKWMAEDLKECVAFGRDHGVMIAIQNHAHFLKTSDQVLKLLEMVDSEWCGVVLDTGSFRSEDPYSDIARLVPHAVNWQIKDKLLGRDSDVMTDLKKLMHIIKDGGYRGYIPIETLGVGDPRVEVPLFLKKVRDAMG